MKAGQSIGHYEILEMLGEGGMGVVYKARDTRLGRFAALKLLPPERVQDRERRARFTQEARSASALNHPNIVTIYDIDQVDGIDFIAMEYVPGQTLAQKLHEGGLPVKEALGYAIQIADALAKAHAAGLVHRDLKPSNIMVTSEGTVKILDFGLAKLAGRSGSSAGLPQGSDAVSEAPTEAAAAPADVETRPGMILGTVAYMAPEQAEGKPVDHRADLFSFGVVLYEMLSGRQPFRRDSTVATLAAVLRDPAPALTDIRRDIPSALGKIVRQALEKRPEARQATAADLLGQLRQVKQNLGSIRGEMATRLRRPSVLAAIVLLLAGGLGGLGILIYRAHQTRWARGEALTRVKELLNEGKGLDAFDLATRIRRLIPRDPNFLAIWPEVAHTIPITTDPPGAELYLREVGDDQRPWRHIGQSPLEDVPLPDGYFMFKAVKSGFADDQVLGATYWSRIEIPLPPPQTIPEGMVLVPGTKTKWMTISHLGNILLPAQHYFMDRYEVSNREFKQFVDNGGYDRRDLWRYPIIKDGEEITWEQARKLFVDKTGRPGPATWEGSSYPGGQELHPVGGVSWYEAAAYAEFAGKSLPSISHWYWAADPRIGPFVTRVSNFDNRGPATVGSYKGIGAYGTYDMAGNLREWCWNETDNRARFILGGAWNNATYLAYQPSAVPPLERDPGNGFRCAKYPEPPPQALLDPKQPTFREYSLEKPVDDAAFQFIRNAYAYNPKPLEATVLSVDDSGPDWRLETVTFAAAYPDERVKALMLLPRSSAPPYQAVVFHPGAGAVMARFPVLDSFSRIDFVIRSGRAVIYPIYFGTYDRPAPPDTTALDGRNRQVKRLQDMRRSVEYLLSRPDIDADHLAYVGSSWGAASAPMMLALENRFKVALLIDGGLYSSKPEFTEVDHFQFLPRVRIPVLMLNGENDFIFPLEASQKPFFSWLGTAKENKRHVVYPAAHDVMLRRAEVIGEALGWLDRYLGPVSRSTGSGRAGTGG